MENESEVGLYDILQSLALIHSELVQIRELLEKGMDMENSKKTQTTLEEADLGKLKYGGKSRY